MTFIRYDYDRTNRTRYKSKLWLTELTLNNWFSAVKFHCTYIQFHSFVYAAHIECIYCSRRIIHQTKCNKTLNVIKVVAKQCTAQDVAFPLNHGIIWELWMREFSRNEWVHTQHCSYWCPGAKAPGHQYPRCWMNIHSTESVSNRNITFVGNNVSERN